VGGAAAPVPQCPCAPVRLIDSHSHLADPAFDADRAEVLARARAAGVEAIVCVADGVAASGRCLELAAAHRATTDAAPRLAATAGLHPHHASEFSGATAGALERLLADPLVVAVGETGLDYHYDRSPRPRQREAFGWHLAEAARRGKPVIVHAREADEDTARLLSEAPAGLTGVLHCFSAGRPVLEAALARGLCVSWSGLITFRNWDAGWAVEAVPDEQLLVETDAPYLAPVPHRGKRNEPAFVAATAARLAELRGMAPQRLAELTAANARRLFRLGSLD
jgi:TatD DNase family protein